MKFVKLQSKLLFACIALISVSVLLKADYYQPDFFPIGLTGINFTGDYTTPYGNVDIEHPWVWQWDATHPNAEDFLIFSLGVNCIGCSDACFHYLIHYDDTLPGYENNYLHKVCIPSFLDDGDSTNPTHIYIIIFTDITDITDSLESR